MFILKIAQTFTVMYLADTYPKRQKEIGQYFPLVYYDHYLCDENKSNMESGLKYKVSFCKISDANYHIQNMLYM